MNIFLAEDDRSLCGRIERFLNGYGHIIYSVSTENQLLSQIEKHLNQTDLYLLDVHIDNYSCLDLLPWLHKNTDAPVILISADLCEDCILKAYSLLADDYIEKPIRPQILLAKINAIARRAGLTDCVIHRGSWSFDRQNGILEDKYSQSLQLFGSHKVLFGKLFSSCPKPVSKEILKSLLSSDYTDGAIRVRISELRKLLPDQIRIVNLRTDGYQMRLDEGIKGNETD